MTDNVNTEKMASTINALNGKFENKVANKKNDLTGDYSSDLVSYPTCQGVKNYFGQKVTQWNATPLDTNYPSEKLVKDTLDSVTTNLQVTVEQQAAPEAGFAATYVVKQNGIQVGSKINIIKDKMLRSATLETVGATPTAEETANHLSTGDAYIKLVVNTEDNAGATNLIIPISTAFDLQTGDDATIVLNNNGTYSIKPGYVESVIDSYLDYFIANL